MLSTAWRDTVSTLAGHIQSHFDTIEQDVPAQSLLVGGAVRDALMGVESNDLDFVVLDETPGSMRERGFEPIDASSFPVFHDSERQEWALARTEQKDGEGYTGFEVSTDDVTLAEDLYRRDLTINSMALGVGRDQRSIDGMSIFTAQRPGEQWALFDPNDGIDDLDDGVLRHVSDAFADDPLRILRVARYAARFPAMRIEGEANDSPMRELVGKDTMSLMRSIVPELNRMSRDRIGMEIRKAMEQSARPSRFFEVLRDCGALAVIWPELDRASIVPAGPEEFHAEGSTFRHTMMVLDRMHEHCAERGLDGHDRVRRLFMAVAHDIGKVLVADDSGGLHSDDPPRQFGGHDAIGASSMEDMCRRMGLRNELTAVMEDAARHHMDFHDVVKMLPSELLSFVDEFVLLDGTNETLPENTMGDTIKPNKATPFEMMSLALADHEGRVQVDDGEKSIPEFDYEVFEKTIRATIDAKDVDGHEALETGLCDEHSVSEIRRVDGMHVDEGEAVNTVMSKCPSCRTPGEWVGERLQSMQAERLRDLLVQRTK